MWASRQVFRLMLSCWGTVATVGKEGGLIRLNHLSMSQGLLFRVKANVSHSYMLCEADTMEHACS